ncbi:MAG: sufS [Francisellaceae bacterium]|nr:sufS [Francisellaceae bacterium]
MKNIAKDFPILDLKIHGKRLVYLDNAATTQKPKQVIQAYTQFYTQMNANIHRGVHHLSEVATEAYENARGIVQDFLNAKSASECIFTRSTTEAINCVAYSFGEAFIRENDEILISSLEHHSNIVPWQMLCERKKAKLKIIPMNEQGELIQADYEKLLNPKVKLIALSHASNALGTVNPIKEMIQKAHSYNIPVLIDGAQAAPHLSLDVQDLDCDFYTFSGHKIYGPTGIGVLYAKEKWLNELPPYQGGGDMILSVEFGKTVYNQIPYKFEAGTPPIAEAYVLGEALNYFKQFNLNTLMDHENSLLSYAHQMLEKIPGLTAIGTSDHKVPVLSFYLEGIHPHDIGTLLDMEGIAVRTGHHCAMPIMDYYKIPASVRVSFGLYNTLEDVDDLVRALHKVIEMFKR